MHAAYARLAVIAASLLILPTTAAGQMPANDLSNALIGTTITPGIEISYAGDTSTRKFENNQPGSSPIKTVIYPDGHEKFFVEDGIMKGFLHLVADYPKFFYAGTAFKITNVILGKQDVELLLAPVPAANDTGDVRLTMVKNYQSKPVQELVAIINQMLRVGQTSTAPKKPDSNAAPVTLDCTSKDAYSDRTLSEVILDEAAQAAAFETVGKHLQMQPAMFSDAEIKWNNGVPGADRMFYTLSRSTGILVTNRSGTNLYTVHFDCVVRTKKF